MKRTFRIIYFVVAICELLAISQDSYFRWMTKPLLMATLLIYYVLFSKTKNPIMMFALVVAMLGDMFLLIPEDVMFTFGLGSFMLMQLLYSGLFWQQRAKLDTIAWVGTLGLVGIASLMAWLILPQTGGLFVAVSIYIFVILCMSLTALWRSRDLVGYAMVLGGAVLFLLSDGLLAFAKFRTDFPYESLLVMLTYIAAQYCIVDGYIQGEKVANPK